MRVKNLLINRRANAVLAAVAAIAIFALWGLIAITFLAVTGCDEGMNMTRPVVMEPIEPVEPTTNGEVKEPETPVVDPEVSDEVVVDPEETVEEPDDEVSEEVPEDPVPPMEPETPVVDPEVPVEPEIPEEPEVPVDTTAPTVLAVKWYSDYNGTIPITDDVSTRDTIYTKVVFSELMQRAVADDGSALPALSIVIGGVATRYRVQPYRASGPDFQSGDCKPLFSVSLLSTDRGTTDDYLCKYTIPADTVGTIALRIGSTTADIAGNTLAGESEHDAPFIVPEPPELTPITVIEMVIDLDSVEEVREAARAAFEPYGFSEETTERLVEMKVQHKREIDREESGEISMGELSQIVVQLTRTGYGLSSSYAIVLRAIYVEERPEEAYLLRGALFESIGIAYLIVKEANPDAEGEEFEELFRQAAREGSISIVDIEIP